MNSLASTGRQAFAPLALTLLVIALPAAVALTGCAANRQLSDQDRLSRELRARGLDPRNVIVPFDLSPAMRQWARQVAPPGLAPAERLRRLRDALFDKDRIELEYTWGYTGTAIEVFEQHRANCLAFTNLFVGMAREVGVGVYFLGVERVETYRKQGDLVVVSDHVAIGYGDATVDSDLLVFDFSAYRNEGYRDVRRIPDVSAVAMYYSNRGAETLQEGRVADAANWLWTAVAIDPGLSPAWVNLGVVLRRAGDFERAEAAYKRALEIDPRTASAYQNLAALLQLQGRHQEAEGFVLALQQTPTRNPFSYLALGDISLRGGRLDEARRFYRRAVNLSRDNAEILAALGQLAAATGDLRTARKMLKKAQKIDAQSTRTRRLASMLARGQG